MSLGAMAREGIGTTGVISHVLPSTTGYLSKYHRDHPSLSVGIRSLALVFHKRSYPRFLHLSIVCLVNCAYLRYSTVNQGESMDL